MKNEKCLFSNTQEFLHNIFIKEGEGEGRGRKGKEGEGEGRGRKGKGKEKTVRRERTKA